jgi:hypothetical protein
MEENIEAAYLKDYNEREKRWRDAEKKIIDMEIDFEKFLKELEEMPDSVFFAKLDELVDGTLSFSAPSYMGNLFDLLTTYDSAILARSKVFLIDKYHLKERCRRLNANFSLNEDNKKQILRLNEMFITAYNEAIKEAKELIDIIFKNKGLKEFTVSTKLTPHIDVIEGSELSVKTILNHYLCKYLPEFITRLDISDRTVRKCFGFPVYREFPNSPDTFVKENKICGEMILLANGV